MNKSGKDGSSRRGKRHPLLRLTPIAAACSALLFAAGNTYAQQAVSTKTDTTGEDAKAEAAKKEAARKAVAQTVDTIVVTGIRRGIEDALSLKRNSDSIVEAISAEDIGKLPDVSIAESLARLPGVAGQRVAGRAQVIAIRGLSPDFTGTLLNGRQQVSSGDNRSVEFDQFPSELINAAVVYKTPDASLIGQGLSGTIDLRTLRPLDLRGRTVALNARVERNSSGTLNANTTANGNRLSVSYVDQFANNTVGVALGFAHLDSPGQELHYKSWSFGGLNGDCAPHPEWGCHAPTGIPAGTNVLQGFEATAISRSQKRDGLMGVLEFKPNKDVHSTVDLYYSKFKKDESLRGLFGGLTETWNGDPSPAYSNITTTTIGTTPLVTGATIKNLSLVVRNDLNTRDDTIKAAGWNTEVKLGDLWKATADLSYSRADRSENVIETYAAGKPNFGTFNITIPTGAGFPTLVPSGLNYADASQIKLSDPAGWGHDGLWKKPKTKDELTAMQLNAKRELSGIFSAIDFGINSTTRQKDREMNELEANLKNGRAPILVPSQFVQAPTSLSTYGIPGVLAYDVMGVLGSLYDIKPTALGEVTKRNYEVKEKVTTAFVKANIDSDFGGTPVRGNLGVQFIHTDQSSHGFSRLAGTASETTRGTTYNDVLPSLNLNFDLGGDRHIRTGLAKTLARGRMDDMRAGADVSINTTGVPRWSGSGGNPQLQPWRATSADLSFEQYFGKRSYVAVAGFYKKLKSYIYNRTLLYDFSGIPNTTTLIPAGNLGDFTRPENGNGGEVRGVEVSGAIEGNLISKALDGFGALASASHTESNVSPNGPGTSAKLPGLSGVVASLTAYYEKAGFSARVSERYRSKFRGEITGVFIDRQFSEILADKQTDAQMSYDFTSGSLKGVSVLFQVNNLTNSPYASRQGTGFSGDTIAPERYDKYGRQYLLGVSYKM